MSGNYSSLGSESVGGSVPVSFRASVISHSTPVLSASVSSCIDVELIIFFPIFCFTHNMSRLSHSFVFLDPDWSVRSCCC
jgi:hypothetical protein